MPSQRRPSKITLTASSVDRSRSVSSIRNRKLPPMWRAYSQLNKAVRAVPMCIMPVGEGAIRVRTGRSDIELEGVEGAVEAAALSTGVRRRPTARAIADWLADQAARQ